MTTNHLKKGVEQTTEKSCVANIPQTMYDVQYSVSIMNQPLSQTLRELLLLLLSSSSLTIIAKIIASFISCHTYVGNNNFSHWSTILLEKLIADQKICLLWNSKIHHRAQKRAPQWTLFWASWDVIETSRIRARSANHSTASFSCTYRSMFLIKWVCASSWEQAMNQRNYIVFLYIRLRYRPTLAAKFT
jgi:hypothetical protein